MTPLKRVELTQQDMVDLIDYLDSNDLYKSRKRDFEPSCIYGVKDKTAFYIGKDAKSGMVNIAMPYYVAAGWRPNLFDEKHPMWYTILVTQNGERRMSGKSVTGPQAFNYMRKTILGYYSQEELKAILDAHPPIPGIDKMVTHHILFSVPIEDAAINAFPNCYEVDICSAYAAGLKELFPKAGKAIDEIYRLRGRKPWNKQILNYSIGTMQNKDEWRGIRHYIVARTSAMVTKAVLAMGGFSKVRYANTDGFIIQDPDMLIETGKAVGAFKIVSQGTLYTFACTTGRHYTVGQMNDERAVCGGGINVKIAETIHLSSGEIPIIKADKMSLGVPGSNKTILKFERLRTERREIKEWR